MLQLIHIIIGGIEMRKKIQSKIFDFSYILEIIISIILGVAIVILSVRLFGQMLSLTLKDGGNEAMVNILDSAMTLAIGVEFIKMLCKHTPETVVEVLMFAIARQLVVLHTTPLENLITIVSIAILFAVRRFLLKKGFDWTKRKNKSDTYK